jgi:acyl-CoA synthetase (AMP-forming)/AMP-acid ligase II
MTGRAIVADRLSSLYRDWPGEQALQFTEPGPEGPTDRWYAWGELGELAARLGSALDRHAVPAESAVAIVMRQRPVLVAAELATLSSGRPAMLLTPLQADRALADEIRSTRPAVLVAHTADWDRDGVADAIAASGAIGIAVDDDFGANLRVRPDAVQSGPALDAAVTVLTSGTTGPPKRLPVAWDTFARLGGGPDGRDPKSNRGALILSLPLVTLGGLLSMARLVFMGRPMAMTERFDVRTWAALVKQHRPKVMGAPPPVVKMILDADIAPDHFEGVTAYTTSSAAIPPDVIRQFEARYGIPVLLGYGATEFLNSVTGWTPALWAEFGETKVGSVGRALPGVGLRVVDGLLEVDPPERAEGLPSGWLRTADRARIDDDGFVWILGRADGVIVRGGFKVDLSRIEDVLTEHDAVSAACAVGLPDERLGEVPGAMVVVRDGTTRSDLMRWCRDRLPPYAVPAVIEIVDAMPQTSTFKQHRAKIRDMLLAAREGARHVES